MSHPLPQLRQDIRAGKIAPVFVIFGEESWGKDTFCKLLRDSLIDPSLLDFNYESFSAKDISANAAVDKAGMLPMMADKRLLVVRECEMWKAKDQKVMNQYLTQPNESTCLVLDFTSADRRKKLFQHKKTVRYTAFDRPKPWELEKFLHGVAREQGLKLAPDAAALMAELAGEDIAKVHRELEKLSLYKLGTATIEAEDVAALMGRTRHVTRYELNDFIGARDLGGALVKAHDILNSGGDLIPLLSAVGSYIKQLFQVKTVMMQGMNNRSQVGQMLRLPPNIAAKLMAKQKSYSSYELRRALGLLANSDYLVKSSGLKKDLVIDHLLCQIITPTQLSPPPFNRKAGH